MGVASFALPVGVLAGICICMFVFFCWWFPRYWKKGLKADMDEVDEARRVREMTAARQQSEGGDIEAGGTEIPMQPPKTFRYTPPVVTAY